MNLLLQYNEAKHKFLAIIQDTLMALEMLLSRALLKQSESQTTAVIFLLDPADHKHTIV